jgi:23S rRNA G2445 N2-methylase RlmL
MPAHRYLATFAAGFEPVIGELLSESLSGATALRIESGMVIFEYSGPFDRAASPSFFNNVFLVLREWKTSACSFSDMVKGSASSSRIADAAVACRALKVSSFRVRFSKENAFQSVDKKVTEAAERLVSSGTGLASDRFSPGIEFWFLIRREDYACFALRLTKKQSTEKYLAQGELRPEICRLVIALAGIGDADRALLDPFAGHGSIPEVLARLYPVATVYASDASRELVAALERRFSAPAPGAARVVVRLCDALELSYCADASIDAIVTDPPWGEWEGSSFGKARGIADLYRGMLAEFDRVLAPTGRACVLTGAKREFEAAVAESTSFAASAALEGFRTDILVNGKKCAVYRLART